QDEITRVIREDPEQPGLLFVGTETGVYVSLDGGGAWQRLPGNLPVAPVYDMKIKDGDLVIATHGRAFWILDDLTPLRELAAGLAQETPHLFPPRRTLRRWLHWGVYGGGSANRNYRLSFGLLITYFQDEGEEGEAILRMVDSGENPPQGVIVYYTLPEEVPDNVSLTFLDENGEEIRTFTRRPAQAGNNNTNGAAKPFVPARPGLNRFVWDMRYPEPEKLEGDPVTEKATVGPFAKPGSYQVRLTVGDAQITAPFEIYIDPGTGTSHEDMEEQFALWQQIVAKIDQTHKTIKRIRRVRDQVTAWGKNLAEAGLDEPQATALQERVKSLASQLTEVEQALVQTEAKTAFDRLRLPTKLNAKLVGLVSVVASADAPPTRQTYDVFAKLSGEVDEQLEKLDSILEEGIADFNAALEDAGVPPVVV
ncbi:MAG: glycosyl hydrolase, partial [Caldilineae bacterium]